ncbi:hypothetical protein ACFYOT_35800 [Saccharothrix saharensis]|uniref:hypothetical protein n=1 Tax=Saccharothrix saharensis TaxID=571190 RepID=UPI0036AE119A
MLAATAAVLVASTTAGGARPEGGAVQDRPAAGVAAATSAQDLNALVLLYATSGQQRSLELRFEVCTLPDSPDPRRTAFKVDVRTNADPVNGSCLNVDIPAGPVSADALAGTGTDREPATAADQDYGAVTVVAADRSALDLRMCEILHGMILGIGTRAGFDDDCREFPITG